MFRPVFGALLLLTAVSVATNEGQRATAVEQASASSAPIWTAELPQDSTPVPVDTTSTGVLAYDNMTAGSQLSALQSLTSTGKPVWGLSASSTYQPIGAPLGNTPYNDIAVDAVGNTYVVLIDYSSGAARFESFNKSGGTRWADKLSSSCDYGSGIALGWNGVIYISGRGGCQDGSHVLGFNELTGQETLDLKFADATGLFTYQSGLVVVVDGSVYYCTYQGTCADPIFGNAADHTVPTANAGNGAIFLAGTATSGPNCQNQPTVEKITPAGIQWTWTGAADMSCPLALTSTPDGGVILQAGFASGEYASISSTGNTRWLFSPTELELNPYELYAGAPVVDTAGNVALPFDYFYSTAKSPQNIGVAIDFLTEDSSSEGLPRVNIQEDNCTHDYGQELQGIGVADNELFVGLTDSCSPYSATLQSFLVPGISADYAIAVSVPGGVAPPPPAYVSLGDSYSSGEGNPPYYNKTCQQSYQAWPVDFAKDSNSFQFVSNLACSGAPTTALENSFDGQPPQLDALSQLNLTEPISLVTVTMGGDNGNLFSTVLTKCYLHGLAHENCSGAIQKASQEIESLQPTLENAYQSIESTLPGVPVVAVGYPNLFPVPPAPTVNCSWLVGDDQQGLVNLATEMDQVMSAAASAVGVQYVSTLQAFTGHELCTTDSWVNPIEGGGSGNAHPNKQGQKALASIVDAAITP